MLTTDRRDLVHTLLALALLAPALALAAFFLVAPALPPARTAGDTSGATVAMRTIRK